MSFGFEGPGFVYGVIRTERYPYRALGVLRWSPYGTEQGGECCASGRSCVVAYVRRVVVVRRQKKKKPPQKSIIPSIHPSSQVPGCGHGKSLRYPVDTYDSTLREHPATSQTTSYPYALGPWTNNGLLLYRGGCGWCQSPPVVDEYMVTPRLIVCRWTVCRGTQVS